MIASLRAFETLHARECAEAAAAYDGTGNYVLCDELGRPFNTATLRSFWYRLMRQAGVPKIKPYTASRHAAGSYLLRMGLSPAVVAAWLGQADGAFMVKNYGHSRPEDLAAVRDALAARSKRNGEEG